MNTDFTPITQGNDLQPVLGVICKRTGYTIWQALHWANLAHGSMYCFPKQSKNVSAFTGPVRLEQSRTAQVPGYKLDSFNNTFCTLRSEVDVERTFLEQ